MTKKIYIIAGEASGDLHASNLVKEMISIDKDIHLRGFGGEKMDSQGVDIVVNYKEIAFMGFKEVIMNISTISAKLKFCKSDILKFNPDIIVLIDYPGFNIRVAKFAKKHGFRVAYYISPQIWAWKESRIKKIKKYIDRMICILPFEKDYYKRWDFEVDYVGHPLTDVINSFSPDPDFRKEHDLEGKNIIAVLPGSRKQEIQKILPEVIKIGKDFPEYQFVIAGSTHIDKELYSLHPGVNCQIIFDCTYDLLKNACAGIITSGTATLEAALFELPFVVCYKTTNFTYSIFKSLVKVKYISLVNLILDKQSVRELIQNDLNENSLKKELDKLLNNNNYRKDLQTDFVQLKNLLKKTGASKRAAEIIASLPIDNN